MRAATQRRMQASWAAEADRVADGAGASRVLSGARHSSLSIRAAGRCERAVGR